MKVLALLAPFVLTGVCLRIPSRAEELGHGDKPVRIGLGASLFRDMPDGLVDTMAKPFGTLMSAQTGMNGEMVRAGDVGSLSRQLAERQVHLGVFQGFEYAWARQKYPQIKPLVIAVNQSKHLRAFLVVRADSAVRDFGDLKDKTLNLPRGSKGHCHLFVESRCQGCGQCAPDQFLGRINAGANAEEALDDIVDGTAEAAVVEGVALECYKRRKPGRCASLKVAVESEVFPTGVVVYCPGTLDEKVLARFRTGLLNANKSILGRQLLTLWKLTGFEPVPEDYEQTVANILKAYPPPTE